MSNAHVDENALNELKNIMGDDFSLLIDTFLNDSVSRIQAIGEAISTNDAEGLRTSAHSFKGSALNISAGLLTEHCKKLEDMGREGQLAGASDIFEAVKVEFENVKNYLAGL